MIYTYCRSQKCTLLVERWNKNKNAWTTILTKTNYNENGYQIIYPGTTFYMNGNTASSTASYANQLRITLLITELSASP
jgi:hypothetical protein